MLFSKCDLAIAPSVALIITFVLSVQFSRCNLVRKNCAALHPSQAKGIRSASFLLPLKFKAKALNLVGAQLLVPSKLNNARNEKV